MIPQKLRQEAYEKMLLIRLAEEAVEKDFLENKIFSFYHSSKGQEAVAVGVTMALQPEDRVYGNHRSHGHYLAKGGDLYRMFCEIYGKADGCCKGFGGSMHMLDFDVNFMGSTPLLGSVAPIATGSAFEQKYSGAGCSHRPNGITVCFFGDGASEEGVVYESINLAAVMKLPILFVIEDNLYAVNTPHSARRAPLFSRRMLYEGLGVRFLEADGNDFTFVYSQATMLAKAIRGGKGPAVLYTRTYRHMAHSGPITDESVRVEDTKETREVDDPLRTGAAGLDDRTREYIGLKVAGFVKDAWQRAKDAPLPNPADAEKGIYAD